MRFDDLPCQHEAQTRARDSALASNVPPEELREDAVLMVFGDSKSSITHPDRHLVSEAPGPHFHLATLGRVLDPIGKKVPDHLGKPVSVASDQERLAGRLESKRVRLALSRVQDHLRSEESVEVDGFVTELQSLLFDALEIEEIVQKRREPVCFRPDHLQVAPPFVGREIPVEHERGEPEHARQRSPQLVRDVAHQFALHLLALRQGLISLLQVREGSLE